MVKIELIELTDKLAKYRYYPEDSTEFGIVILDRRNSERKIEKSVNGYSSNYAAHALHRIEEYQKLGNYKEKDIIAWY